MNRTDARAGRAIADLFQRYLSEYSDGTNSDPTTTER